MTRGGKTKALIELVEKAKTIFQAYGRHELVAEYGKALAAFEPEPEMVYTMPEWRDFCEKLGWRQILTIVNLGNGVSVFQDDYNALRELTRVPKAKMGREWWIKVFDTFGAGSPVGGIWNDKQIAEANCAGSGIAPLHVREVLPEEELYHWPQEKDILRPKFERDPRYEVRTEPPAEKK